MKVYERSLWKKVFGAKPPKKKVDSLKDIQAIIEFLEHAQDDPKALLEDLHKLEELEKERKVASKKLVPVNLEAQEEILDSIIQRYEFFQNDVDINGLRVKQIAGEFLKHASHEKMKSIVKEKKKDPRWKFQW
ncbi:hypothetical protein HOD05_03065 [Candidatus Woesearchaeota archaeon]|jgi:hypothetical protein|nr:hypothetical protein [Candidatus Woesearchaeota archaeon]MBT4151354.1 hypothetical protein [Candidatus Woesearchaeota archaeon]MBT4247752.1 hypothetical protein [Candidatus Woesearchaeota archaeon]MBT4434176.1 hypothetical protein [Candidatus Woesearchaeota archaeon]MBT7332354.1 hypothetical protein [Candidatus Woesearchaeota archaeon]